MKTTILKVASAIALFIAAISCTESNTEVLKEIEKNKTELLRSDSLLNQQQITLSAISSKDTAISKRDDSTQFNLLTFNQSVRTDLSELIKENETLLVKTQKEEFKNEEAENKLKTISFSYSEIIPKIDSIQKEITKMEIQVSEVLKELGDTSVKK